MSLHRLRALLDAYGAAPDRWPMEERAAALALLAKSPEAQRLRAASAQLDVLLDQAPTPHASAALIDRILTAAHAPGTVAPAIRIAPASPISQRMRRAIAAAVPLAAAAALVLWLWTKPFPHPEDANLTVAELESYEVPTDALLDLPIPRALDRIPTFGCTGGGLGCLDAGVPSDQSQSALDLEKYT